MERVSRVHRDRSYELMKQIISLSMKDMNAPGIVEQMTEQAGYKLDSIMQEIEDVARAVPRRRPHNSN